MKKPTVFLNGRLLPEVGASIFPGSISRAGKVLLALCTAAIFLALIWGIFHSHQPVYQGVRLDEWLEAYNRLGLSASNGPVNIEPVSRAILAMGTNSLPFLLRHLMHRDSIIARKFFDLAAKQHLFKLPVHQDYPYYAPSVLALIVLGPDARPILPALLKAALDSSNQALFAMLALGSNAIPTLELACLSTNRETRSQAALYIAALKSAGMQSVLRWDWSQDSSGRHVLLKIHDKRPDDYGAELVNLLQSPNAAVRLASADAIAFHPLMRMPVQSAMSLLRERLNDPNPKIRKSAAEALKELNASGSFWRGIPNPRSGR